VYELNEKAVLLDRATGQAIGGRDLVDRTLAVSKPLEWKPLGREQTGGKLGLICAPAGVCGVEMSDRLSGLDEMAAADRARSLERVRER